LAGNLRGVRAIVILAAGEVVALVAPRGGLAPGHDALGAGTHEVLDADAETVAEPLHDVERRRDLIVLDLRQVRDRDPGRFADLRQRLVERPADFLQAR